MIREGSLTTQELQRICDDFDTWVWVVHTQNVAANTPAHSRVGGGVGQISKTAHCAYPLSSHAQVFFPGSQRKRTAASEECGRVVLCFWD